MKNIYFLIIITLFLSSSSFCKAQTPAYHSLKNGKVFMKVPNTWTSQIDTIKDVFRISVTPDTLADLTIKAIELFEIKMHGRTFAKFKEDFDHTITSRMGGGRDSKILRKENIVFKGYQTVYAEAISNNVRTKNYGVNCGSTVYLLILVDRDVNGVFDTRMQKEEEAILSSLIIYK